MGEMTKMPRNAEQRALWVAARLKDAGVTSKTHTVNVDGTVMPIEERRARMVAEADRQLSTQRRMQHEATLVEARALHADAEALLKRVQALGEEMAAAEADDPAATDDSNELLDRIVRRAQYTALKAMLDMVDGWVEGVRDNNVAMNRPNDDVLFEPLDIKRMVNDVARELGTAQPFKDAR
jgi:hypothetical protein